MKVGVIMREIKNLNFEWLFKENCSNDLESELSSSEGYNVVDLPHTIKELPLNYFSEKDYQMLSCYKKTIRVLPSMLKKELFLVCEGIAHSSKIYIDDTLVNFHEGGYDEFKVNVTNYLTQLKDYTITIFVDSNETKDIPPFGNVVDYLGYGGIYREVYLEMVDSMHIEDVYAKCYYPMESNIVNFEIKVSGGTEINISIDGVSVDYEITKEQDIYNFEIDNKILWSIDNPHMYKAIIKLYNGYTVCDEIELNFGVRCVEFKSDGFYLNGEHILLKGLNRHQSYPYVGYAMPESMQRLDAQILKNKLGVNVVRCSHYMQSKYFLDECDKLGLLVIEEIPGWQYIGGNKFKELTYQNITSMITRDKNHPSIILWGVRINESADDDEFYKKTNLLSHRLDDLRKTCGVRNFGNSNLLEDVYTYNDFANNGGKVIFSPKKQITNVENPYLITENNGHMFPTKSFDNESRRVEHSLRHLKALNEIKLQPGLSGMLSWCMNDYNTHKDFGSGDMICYHGVLDMFRNPKFASFAYSSQQDKYPFLEVTSSVNIGEYDAGLLDKVIIYTNLDYVKVSLQNDTETIVLGDYYPAKDVFKGLNHPPIIFDDFIGNRLVDEEHIDKKDSDIIKKLFKEISKSGYNIYLKSKLQMFKIMKKYHYSLSDATSLFFKYSSLWGKSSMNLVFEGYSNNEVSKVVRIGEVISTRYDISISKDQLTALNTYDVLKIDIKKVDQNNNILTYSNDCFRVECDNNVTFIGPSIVSLIGGQISIYIKSTTNSRKERFVTKNKDISATTGNVRIYDNKNSLIYEKEIKVLLEKQDECERDN